MLGPLAEIDPGPLTEVDPGPRTEVDPGPSVSLPLLLLLFPLTCRYLPASSLLHLLCCLLLCFVLPWLPLLWFSTSGSSSTISLSLLPPFLAALHQAPSRVCSSASFASPSSTDPGSSSGSSSVFLLPPLLFPFFVCLNYYKHINMLSTPFSLCK